MRRHSFAQYFADIAASLKCDSSCVTIVYPIFVYLAIFWYRLALHLFTSSIGVLLTMIGCVFFLEYPHSLAYRLICEMPRFFPDISSSLSCSSTGVNARSSHQCLALFRIFLSILGGRPDRGFSERACRIPWNDFAAHANLQYHMATVRRSQQDVLAVLTNVLITINANSMDNRRDIRPTCSTFCTCFSILRSCMCISSETNFWLFLLS